MNNQEKDHLSILISLLAIAMSLASIVLTLAAMS